MSTYCHISGFIQLMIAYCLLLLASCSQLLIYTTHLPLGIPPTGSAAIDDQRSQASITIRGSDEPHGVFRFAETSLMAGSTEAYGDLDLYVSRGFGAVGDVKVYFEVIPGQS